MKTLTILSVCVVCLACASVFANVLVVSDSSTHATIQGAVDHALDPDQLQVTTGLYVENVTVSNKQLLIEGGYYPSFLDKTNDPTCTVVSGSNGFLLPTFLVAWDANVTFEHLEIIRGATFFGGGISVADNCVVTSRECRVLENTAWLGGGCYAASNALLVLIDTVVGHNGAVVGGGVYGYLDSTVVIEGPGSLYLENHGDWGGAIAMNCGTLVFRDSARIGCNIASQRGGGIHLENNASATISGLDTFIGLSIAKPAVTNGDGGGIYAVDSSVIISGALCYLGSAEASGNGGGVYLTNSSLTVMDGATLGELSPGSMLSASNGGAVYMVDSTLLVTNNSRIYRGRAADQGGGIYAWNSSIGFYDGAVLGSVFPPDANSACLGGGIAAVSCTTRFEFSSVLGNHAEATGGGLVAGGTGSTYFLASTIAENTASNMGGAIVASSVVGDFVLDCTEVLSNRSDSVCGGITWASFSELRVLPGSRICYNEAGTGAGGLYVMFGTVSLEGVEVSYNRSGGDAGAIAVGMGALDCVDCDINENSADGVTGLGGAVFVRGGSASFRAEHAGSRLMHNSAAVGGAVFAATNAHLTFIGSDAHACIIEGNTALSNGGAVFAENIVTAEFRGNVFIAGNRALNGGAIFACNKCCVALLYTNGCAPVLAANTARMNGGGVAIVDGGQLTGMNCVFADNVSSNDGGAVYAANASVHVSAEDFMWSQICGFPPCRFEGNRAENRGGAIYSSGMGFLGGTHVADALLVSNRAVLAGGGAYVAGSGLDMVNSVIAHNTAPIGGGLWAEGAALRLLYCTIANNASNGVNSLDIVGACPLIMTNCIVWGNLGTQVTTGAMKEVHYCDIEGGYPTGTGNIDADPLFANAVGTDYALTEFSPCIDTGIVAGIGHDCIGTFRPQFDGYDMGAYEFVPEPVLFVIGYWLLVICHLRGRRSS